MSEKAIFWVESSCGKQLVAFWMADDKNVFARLTAPDT